MKYGYILVNRQPVLCDDLEEWGRYIEHKWTLHNYITDKNGDRVLVSTVFLGIDHRLCGEGPPILFETMIFGGEHDGKQWRYETIEKAEAGHQKTVLSLYGQNVNAPKNEN